MLNIRARLANLARSLRAVLRNANTPLIILIVVTLIATMSLVGYTISRGNGDFPILGSPRLRTEPPVTAPLSTPPYPTISPTATTAPPTTPPTTTPPVTVPPSGGGLDATGNYITCPNVPNASGPSGNTFAGKTYDGAHVTLSSDVLYTVGSNTCIENFNFTRGELNIQGGASNVLIINNKMSGWPWSGTGQGRAIDGLLSGGSNIVVNYNTFANPIGSNIWTGIYGRGAVNGLTVTHNNWQPINVDDMQINCSSICNNVTVMYNRMVQSGRFIVEDQQVVHNERWAYNYSDINWSSSRQGGQVSIAHSNDTESGGYFNDISSGIEIDHNIVIDANKAVDGFGDCFESRGPGNNLHDNYCWGYHALVDYAFTSPQSFGGPSVWHTTNNTIVGPGSGSVSEWEGFERAGYSNVTPTESGNIRIGYPAQPTPSPPAWTYANGAQW